VSDRRYAVLVASSQFPNEPKLQPLRCPENDVDGLHDVLTSKTYGDFTDALVLKNVPHYEALLRINQVLKRADKDDFVLIYYSGHGKLDLAGRLHLATADTTVDALEATSIPVESIRNYVDVSSCNKVALILDCCFSGAVGAAFARGSLDDQLRLASGGRGTYLMTASTGVQVALEKERDQNGVFTKHVIEGIRGAGADLDGDGCVTMDELYRYVHDRVLDEGFQEPMKWDLNVRGVLVVARTGRSPREERRKALRDRLLDLAHQGSLPNRILSKALDVIAQPSTDTSDALRRYNALLDQLLQDRLKIGDFIEEWYDVGAGPSPERAPRQDAAVIIDTPAQVVADKTSHTPKRPVWLSSLERIRPALNQLTPHAMHAGQVVRERLGRAGRLAPLVSTSAAIQVLTVWALPALMGDPGRFALTVVAVSALSGIVFGEVCRRRGVWPGVAGGWLANAGVVFLILLFLDMHDIVRVTRDLAGATFVVGAAVTTALDLLALRLIVARGDRPTQAP